MANGSVSLPRSSNRTCGFAASGFPTGLATGSREDARLAAMAHSKHAEFAEDRFPAERSDAARGHLVASDEEIAHAVIDMSVDDAVRSIMRAGAEVAAPAAQEAVETLSHLFPAADIAADEHRAHLVLETLHALLGGTGAEISPSGLAEDVDAEAKAQEVERVLPCVAQSVFVRFRVSPSRAITRSVHSR